MSKMHAAATITVCYFGVETPLSICLCLVWCLGDVWISQRMLATEGYERRRYPVVQMWKMIDQRIRVPFPFPSVSLLLLWHWNAKLLTPLKTRLQRWRWMIGVVEWTCSSCWDLMDGLVVSPFSACAQPSIAGLERSNGGSLGFPPPRVRVVRGSRSGWVGGKLCSQYARTRENS